MKWSLISVGIICSPGLSDKEFTCDLSLPCHERRPSLPEGRGSQGRRGVWAAGWRHPRQAQRRPAAPRGVPGIQVTFQAVKDAFFPAWISTPSITQDYSIRICDATLVIAKIRRVKNYVRVWPEQEGGARGWSRLGRAGGRAASVRFGHPC